MVMLMLLGALLVVAASSCPDSHLAAGGACYFVTTETAPQGALDPADLALLTRIQELEDQLREQQGLPDAIPTLPNQRHRAFDDIEGQIAAGEYLAARSRLYSLLAVVDRFDAVRAREIEEQASYLLADTYRLELEDQEHNL